MKYQKITLLVLSILLFIPLAAQLEIHYNPGIQPTERIQYFKPLENDLFVGDCIPFAYNGTFYLYWLIDKGHHSALNGLGGHQWVLSASKDMVHWKHYPVVIGIDEEWEKSICTGSVIYANNSFYAFYATRVLQNGIKQEQLSYATGKDPSGFIKQKPNPFFSAPPGYDPSQFRDPKIISGKDGYHLFISSYLSNTPIKGYGGCLAHLFSPDLINWSLKDPVLTGQKGTPECSDYFYWNGWYYLIYSCGGTYYVMSKNPFGSWEYPKFQPLKETFARVPKTAEFGNGRRIAVAWIAWREENKDDGRAKFGGNMVFRELVQGNDGSLGIKFLPEMWPKNAKEVDFSIIVDTATAFPDSDRVRIEASGGIGSAHLNKIPLNCRITMEIELLGNCEEYGLYLRSNDKADGGYRLNFSPDEQTVQLGNLSIESVDGLRNTNTLEIIMKRDIIDVCVNNRRCIVNRCPEQKGNQLWLYAKQGNILFKHIQVYEL